MFSHHLLSVILFTPTIGALLLLLLPRGAQTLHRLVGNLFGILGFAVSLPLVIHFPAGYQTFTFVESADWIPSIGARYTLGLDGISFLLVMLTTFLGMIAILSSWSAIQLRTKEYYILSCSCSRPACSASSCPSTSSFSMFSGKSCSCLCISSSVSGAAIAAYTRPSNSSCTPWPVRSSCCSLSCPFISTLPKPPACKLSTSPRYWPRLSTFQTH